MKSITAQSGQTIEDIALQEYGCVEGVVLLLDDNGLGQDDDVFTGQVLQVRDTVPVLTDNNVAVTEYIKNKGLNPNSSMVNDLQQAFYVNPGYWADGYVVV